MGSETLDLGRGTLDSSRLRLAAERSARWLGECVEAHARKDDQALFGIVQGGTDLPLRTWSAGATTAHNLPGYAIGGVAVAVGVSVRVAVFVGVNVAVAVNVLVGV